MLYALEQGPTEKTIFERSQRYGLPLPEALRNAPTLNLGLAFYYNAFWHLSTCRQSGMGIGRITYFDIMRYCDYHDVDNDQRDDLVQIITEMDEVYIEHCNKKSKTKDKPEKPE